MPEDLFGLPTHILLLHVVVVLLPIAAAATVVVVLSARFRHRWGAAVLLGTFVTTLFVPLTTQSGESLQGRLPNSEAIRHHAEVGQQLLIWAAVFGLCLAAVVVVDLVRRSSLPATELTTAETWAGSRLPARWRGSPPAWADLAFRIVQVLALLAAVLIVVLVVRAGHTGAQAVWSNYPDLRSP